MTYEIKDNREAMRNREREVCRGCGSPEIHTRSYNSATIGCVRSLRAERLLLQREKSDLTAQAEQMRELLDAANEIQTKGAVIRKNYHGQWRVATMWGLNGWDFQPDLYNAPLEAFAALKQSEGVKED